MRDLNSEHISFLAALLWGSSVSGSPDTAKKAVEQAIALQQEAKRQCEYLNRLADELEQQPR
jgi:hypothetical protein